MNRNYEYDLLCIGGGPAGRRAAVQAAKLGKKVAVIERERSVGAEEQDAGTIPSETFREAVLSLFNANGLFGGSLSKQSGASGNRSTIGDLFARLHTLVERGTKIHEELLRSNDVEVIPGSGSFEDAHTVIASSSAGTRTVSADNILIAVGSIPQPPAVLSVADAAVITSDDIAGLGKLPRSMIVVGSDVVGIEYASMFAALGVEVTVVDARRQPLEFLDHEIVDELVRQLRAMRVIFRLGETVEQLDIMENGIRRVAVHLQSGKRMTADLALVCAGRAGATDGLELLKAGLRADGQGLVKVNKEFRTDTPNIFAAGDVIGFPCLAAESSEQGRLAACKAFGARAASSSVHVPIGIHTIPEIATVGAAEHDLTADGTPFAAGVARYGEIARGQILGDDTGMVKLLFHRHSRLLLGAHAIGTGAAELIHIGQSVLALGGGLDYFLDTAFNHPTLAECYKAAALDAHDNMAR